MTRNDRQARWRAKTNTKRVEVYLPVDAANRLMELTKKMGQTKAEVIAGLILHSLPVDNNQEMDCQLKPTPKKADKGIKQPLPKAGTALKPSSDEPEYIPFTLQDIEHGADGKEVQKVTANQTTPMMSNAELVAFFGNKNKG